jgi:hypothetical protein
MVSVEPDVNVWTRKVEPPEVYVVIVPPVASTNGFTPPAMTLCTPAIRRPLAQ